VPFKDQKLGPRENFVVALDCSNSEFELRGPHGKRPSFSRWAVFDSANVEAQRLISTLSNVAARGV
jgi:hypothetical protein